MPASDSNPHPALPPHSSAARDWCVLLVLLIACVPALTLGIRDRLTTHTMENLAIVTSQETWYRMAAGDAQAWLVSTNDGEPRLEKPPMVTWLNLLAWSDLEPATAPPQELIFRARCVSVAMGLLLIASIFLLARMLGDVRVAALAALSIASTFYFQRQARTASYDIHYVAWTALAIALGVWAMRPLGHPPTNMRRFIGWGGCAFALVCAAMSKNPLPYLLALPTLIAAMVMLKPRGNRGVDGWWLTGAILVSTIPVVAWYWHVFVAFPNDAERALGREVQQPRSDYQFVLYYLALFGLVVPWTFWLIGGLIEPFRMPRDGGDRGMQRRIAMFALFTFAFIFIGMSIPAAKQQRYILGIVPAIGLLIAAFIRRHDERVRDSDADAGFRMLSAVLWIVLMCASVIAPVFLSAQSVYVRIAKRWMSDAHEVVAPLAWPWAVALAIALLAICGVGWRAHAKQPMRSALATGVWMLALMTAFWPREAASPQPRVEVFRDEAQRVRAIVGDAPLRSLRMTDADHIWQFNEEFRIYYGRLIRRVWPNELEPWLKTMEGDAFVLARMEPERDALLERFGFERVDEAQIDKNDRQSLWRRRASPRDWFLRPFRSIESGKPNERGITSVRSRTHPAKWS